MDSAAGDLGPQLLGWSSVPAEPVLAQRGEGRHGGGRGDRHDRARPARQREPRVVVQVSPPRTRVRVVRQPRQRVVYVQPAPPEPRVVVVPARRRAHTVWVDGYWQWTGRRYIWQRGHWETERGGHRHVQAHWEMRGAEWTLVPATWVVVSE